MFQWSLHRAQDLWLLEGLQIWLRKKASSFCLSWKVEGGVWRFPHTLSRSLT